MTREELEVGEKIWDDYEAWSEKARHYFDRYMKCKSERGRAKNWELYKMASQKESELWKAYEPYINYYIEQEKKIKELLKELA